MPPVSLRATGLPRAEVPDAVAGQRPWRGRDSDACSLFSPSSGPVRYGRPGSPASRPRLEQPDAGGSHDRGGAGGYVELGQDVGDMAVDGAPAQIEPVGDALVGLATSHQVQHLQFSPRQAPRATEDRELSRGAGLPGAAGLRGAAVPEADPGRVRSSATDAGAALGDLAQQRVVRGVW